MRPILRWAGSKRKLLPTLRKYWWESGAHRYIEPFAGSAALYFDIESNSALINDTNKELIGSYRILRSSPRKLYETVVKLPDTKTHYYKLRESDPTQLNPFERAVRFIYLNRNCFNGIYRTNQSGKFNVPYGGVKSGTFPSYDRFKNAAKLLRSAKLSNRDYVDLIKREVQAGDFVYMDPPYAVSNRRIFKQYSPSSFGIFDLATLSEMMNLIDRRGATFLVSYAQSPETKSVVAGWYASRQITQRNVAGFTKHRRKAVEVLVSNIVLK